MRASQHFETIEESTSGRSSRASSSHSIVGEEDYTMMEVKEKKKEEKKKADEREAIPPLSDLSLVKEKEKKTEGYTLDYALVEVRHSSCLF